MPKQILKKTKHKGIYSYETNVGKRYSIRFRYKDSVGEWKEKQESGFENLTKAKMRKAELEIAAKNSVSVFENGKLTFGQWYKKYLELSSNNWSVHTISRFESLYKNHFYVFANKQLSRITLVEVKLWVAEKLESGLGILTVKNMYISLMQIFNSAVEYEVLAKNKLLNVTFPDEKRKVKTIELDDVKRLDEYIFSSNFTILDQAMYALLKIGWRRAEVAGFSFEAIEIINDDDIIVKVIKTRTALTKDNGKAPKTLSSYRSNRITGHKARVIRCAVETAREIYTDFNLTHNEQSFVFINPRSGKLFSPDRTTYILRKCGKKLNIHVTPHMFRHTFASHAINSGEVSVIEVSRHLGHSKIDMTLNTYSHSSIDSQAQITNYIANL